MRKNLDSLRETDQYSLLLFVLYKLTGIKEYAAVSELAYILDKDNLLNLCNIFGGRTIRIPTLDELESLTHIVLLYKYVNNDGMEYDKAVKIIGFKSSELRHVKSMYLKICKILSTYKFGDSDDK